jgi:hypothetical protein
MGIRAVLRLSVIPLILCFCESAYAQDPCCAVGGAVTVMDYQNGRAAPTSPVGVTITVTQDANINYTVKNEDGVYVLYIPNDKIKKFELTFSISNCTRCPKDTDGDDNKVRQNKRERVTLLTMNYLKQGAAKAEVERRVSGYRAVQKKAKADGNQALADSMDQNLKTLESIGEELSQAASQSEAKGQTSEAEFLFGRALVFKETLEPKSLSVAKTYEDYAAFSQLWQPPSANWKAEMLSMRASEIRLGEGAAFGTDYFRRLIADFDPSGEPGWVVSGQPIVRKVDIAAGGEISFNVPVRTAKPTSVTVIGAERGVCSLSVAEKPSAPLRPMHAWHFYGGKAESQVVEMPGKYTFRVVNRGTSTNTCVLRID